MSISFYDNSEIKPDEQGKVTIDRVYCLNFNEFNNMNWERLGQVYKTLPHFIAKENKCPMWFGEEEVSSNYLYASVEPSGLQIVGELTLQQWKEWEDIFRTQLSEFLFPSFEC
ncbi:hypothetical protein [Aneurinibacillus aneurinilyticus]|jgi:hypothetical protein|uniref:Uncharacterized protein n=1 Tax=Aneurinibacillus aneurinilyticus TaxID=1391 RepID=A0A848CUK7_ANEAE|nr:hypothetical protein [Aneurinibacillus aneurinilyticus]MCI1693641.1 hypothetical protein [Aneurinibacillus aneurinilyticus]NME97607.1 hypothetical protein [Aneurinibacillus aneurinilyticus]